MTDAGRRRRGTGETPIQAVRDVAPDSDAAGVEWVEGIRGRLRDGTPADSERTIRHEITVIYESRSPKQWRLEVTYEEDEWEAVVVGSKRAW